MRKSVLTILIVFVMLFSVSCLGDKAKTERVSEGIDFKKFTKIDEELYSINFHKIEEENSIEPYTCDGFVLWGNQQSIVFQDIYSIKDHYIYKVNLDNKLEWKKETDVCYDKILVKDDKMYLVNIYASVKKDSFSEIVCLDKNGEQLWTKNIEFDLENNEVGFLIDSIVVDDGIMVYARIDKGYGKEYLYSYSAILKKYDFDGNLVLEKDFTIPNFLPDKLMLNNKEVYTTYFQFDVLNAEKIITKFNLEGKVLTEERVSDFDYMFFTKDNIILEKGISVKKLDYNFKEQGEVVDVEVSKTFGAYKFIPSEEHFYIVFYADDKKTNVEKYDYDGNLLTENIYENLPENVEYLGEIDGKKIVLFYEL